MIKIWSLFIFTIAFGILAPIGVVSTFSGTHDYQVNENGECQKCHSGIQAQLETSTMTTHANTAWSEKQVFDCAECHSISDMGTRPGGSHAVQKVDCAFCHENAANYEFADYETRMHVMRDEYGMPCDSCHTPPGQSKANMFIDDVFNEIDQPTSAHSNFYQDAGTDGTLLGSSEACIGCHTHVRVQFTRQLGSRYMIYDPSTGKFEMD